MLDNNLATSWRSQGEASPTIIIDLKKEYEIEKVIITWKGLNIARTVDVTTSLLDPATKGAGSGFVPSTPLIFPLNGALSLPGPNSKDFNGQVNGIFNDRCQVSDKIDEVSFASATKTYERVRLVQIKLSNLCDPNVGAAAEIAEIQLIGPIPFRLDPISGVLSTISSKRLDYESMQTYELGIRVTDSQPNKYDPTINTNYCTAADVRPLTCSLYGDVIATVNIDNANDGPTLAYDMRFIPQVFTGRRQVEENSLSGVPVGTGISAWDADIMESTVGIWYFKNDQNRLDQWCK